MLINIEALYDETEITFCVYKLGEKISYFGPELGNIIPFIPPRCLEFNVNNFLY